MLTPQTKERLEQLVRVLEEVECKDYAFDLNDWMMYKPEMMEQYRDVFATRSIDLKKIAHSCGTSACACGYAGLDPKFRELGFKTSYDGGLEFHDGRETSYGWTAVRKFFDLNSIQAEYLFSADSYANGSIDNVIERLLGFIAGDWT